MYVTRSLSHYKSSPEALHVPPDGPNSGYLVIQDQESETSCFGLYRNRYLPELPFPQNKILNTQYSSGSGDSFHKVVLIPVLNQPLSSNRYYAIKPDGRSRKGEAFTCSKDEDVRQRCYCSFVRDIKPRPLDTRDVYQQFEIVRYETACSPSGSFYAKSLAEDGHPPNFLRRKGWQIYSITPKNFELHEAKGIDVSLRSRLPDLTFSPATKTSDSVVIGKWYCPFMFIKEGNLSDQMNTSIFYEVTLEQKWERVFELENNNNDKGHVVSVRGEVRSESVFIGGRRVEAMWDEKNVVNWAVWFMSFEGEETVGLSMEVLQRMKWEEEKVGWVGVGDKRVEKVNREEKFEGSGVWRRFGCYVLVERFVVKRMDGSLVLTYDFGHSHHVKCIFE
ncbi:uncharacterized protein [Rutidosis leptorrhynchoides]|uniref:uncharacterized protein n=1 Tax=Rutidosis leptorrhynchoides TaxID=125765 RepID=UPI003A99D063